MQRKRLKEVANNERNNYKSSNCCCFDNYTIWMWQNSNTSANRHESATNSSKIASKKYTVATYDGNGQKTETFESNCFRYDEDYNPYVSGWEWYPDVRLTATYNIEDDNKKKSWVVNKGVSLIGYEGTTNYFDEYNRQKKTKVRRI